MSDKGLTGLANLGNTCFINSCMQIISHTKLLNDFLDNNNGEYKKKLSAYYNKDYVLDSKLLVEWDNLRKLIWEENRIISPGGFLKAIQYVASHKNKDIFTGYAQNDLPEFLLFIIDSFHNGMRRDVDMVIKGDIKNKKDKLAIKCFEMMKNMYSSEYSELLDIFYGIHVSVIEKDGKELSIKPEPYFIIDLPLDLEKKNISIKDCFEKYCQSERLEGENAVYNEETKMKEDVDRKIKFWNFPNILVIDLKRFTYDGKKIKKPINLELDNLDLSEYVEGYNKSSYIYELYGICNHSGGVLGGHYTATVRVYSGDWYLFNDTNVSKVDFKGENNTAGYCLFYRKKLNK
jgi:ubiquitin C-terminal hydrolase|tara:strand:+ start:52 stop:1092 length:1041 start_codon:yes stop_codon:yes gene_type:complete